MRNSIKSGEREVPVERNNGAWINDTSIPRTFARARARDKAPLAARFVTLRSSVKLRTRASNVRRFTADNNAECRGYLAIIFFNEEVSVMPRADCWRILLDSRRRRFAAKTRRRCANWETICSFERTWLVLAS